MIKTVKNLSNRELTSSAVTRLEVKTEKGHNIHSVKYLLL